MSHFCVLDARVCKAERSKIRSISSFCHFVLLLKNDCTASFWKHYFSNTFNVGLCIYQAKATKPLNGDEL